MTVFLDKIKIKLPKIFSKILSKMDNLIIMLILIALFLYTFQGSSMYKHIIKLSNNLSKIDVIPSTMEIVKNIYPVFNEENYIIENIESSTQEVKEIVIENKIIDNVDYGTLDNIDRDAARNYINSDLNLSVHITNGPGYEAVYIGDNILIKDFSDLPNINYTEIMKKKINLTKTNDNIFAYSTHSSETYSCSNLFNFGYTGTFRTTDSNYNMISVASRFKDFLKEHNINVIHDTTGHDYGSYTMSYASSGASVLANKEKYGNFGISIDIHRDAIEDLSFAPTAVIGGVEVAQCMFVIGIGYDGARNQYYDENLNLAIKLMELGNKVYPGLFRPMIMRNSVYNQDLNDMSILIEVGSTGNTLEQAYRSAKCLANLLDIIYIN